MLQKSWGCEKVKSCVWSKSLEWRKPDMVPKTKGLALLMCELLSASLPIQPCVAVRNFDRMLGHWMHEWPLKSLISLTWGVHPHPGTSIPAQAWAFSLASSYIVGGVFVSSLCSCLLAELCSTVTALCSALPLASPPDRSSRIDLHPNHHPAFSSLGLFMDLNTISQVCPPCSDPTGLCPVEEGSLSHLCLGFEASLGCLGPVCDAPKEL